MSKKILTILKYILFLALGIGLLYFAFHNTDPKQLIRELRSADYFWVLMSVLSGIISYYSRAARWLILLEPLGYKPKFSNSIYSVFFGYFANIAAPRLGELARCTALNQTEKIPLNALIGTVILERVIDVIILFLLVLFAFIINASLLARFLVSVTGGKFQPENYYNLVIIAILFIPLILIPILFRKKIMMFPLAIRVKTFMKGVFDGFASIGKMKKKWWFLFHTAAIWFAYILMTYIGFFAMKETAHLSFNDGIFVTVAGGMGMALPANGGIGTYHTAVMFGLAAIGIEKSAGLVYATIMHGSQVLFIIVTGIFSFVMLYIEKNRIKR